ncbi:hypothetical protein VP01_4358g1 [Puccinia sorghi]|uniref:Integrase catalytic domain-containing protein n=1 Tax=Puccinia sorghi TaxID=27349 RepID=A0A0L6UQM8_9BASI|nr:hypothetical protein VP01_4358g1 [Puccinia sorghi]
MNNCRPCDACTVSKFTRGSFHSRNSKASKPFEEINLDIVGPITPASREGHQYFLTIVDSCTRFCSAIPLKKKSEVGNSLTQALDLEARRIGYNPTVIHSDRGTETRYLDAYTPQKNGLAERFNRTIIESTCTILKDSNLSLNYWNEVIKALTQITAHKIKVSYLYLSEKSNSKLAQIGGLGTLVRYNEELRSYRVATETGKVINSKHLKFLDFPASDEKTSDLEIDDDWIEPEPNILESKTEKDLCETVTLEEGDSINPKVSRLESEPDSESEDEDVIEQTLVPESRTLRDRTSKIKPIKYSYLTGDPDSF